MTKYHMNISQKYEAFLASNRPMVRFLSQQTRKLLGLLILQLCETVSEEL